MTAYVRKGVGLARKVWRHPANRGRRLRQLGLAVVFQVRGRVLRRPTLISIGERSRLWASLDSSASILAAYAKTPDYEEIQVWRRHLQPGDLFIDIGANVGTYTILLAERGVSVVAVEPDEDTVARLRRNIDLNGYRVEIVQAAMSSAPGVVRFTRAMDSLNHIVVEGSGDDSYPVAADTLDNVIGDRQVAGVKVDVEGAERLVLEGARRALLEQRIGLLQLEWNSLSESLLGESRAPVAELLANFGYGLYRPVDGSLVPLADLGYGPDVFAAPERSSDGRR